MSGNIKNLYKHADNFDHQQQYTDILEAPTVSTPEEFTDKSPLSPDKSDPTKNSSSRKSLHQFSDALDVKNNIGVRRLVDAKSKRKDIRAGSILWSSIPKIRVFKKTN